MEPDPVFGLGSSLVFLNLCKLLLVGNTDIIIYSNTDKMVAILKKNRAEFRKQNQGLTRMK